MLFNIIQKYSLKKLLSVYILFSVFIGTFVTYIMMSFIPNPNYKIAFFISTLCSFFGSIILIIPSIILYIRIEKVKKQAENNFNIDSLTKLISRKPFSEQLCETIMTKSILTIGVIYIDLDHFKIVNDTYGHLAGDEVMIEVGQILNNHIPSNGCFGRFGGEEFIGLTTNTNVIEFEALLEQIRAALDTKLIYEEVSIPFTASIGGVLTYNKNIDYDELLRLADNQMYLAKSNGRNRIELLDLVNDSKVKDVSSIDNIPAMLN